MYTLNIWSVFSLKSLISNSYVWPTAQVKCKKFYQTQILKDKLKFSIKECFILKILKIVVEKTKIHVRVRMVGFYTFYIEN